MGIFSIFHNMRFVMGLMEVNDFLGWSDGCDLMILFLWAGIVFYGQKGRVRKVYSN